MSTFQFIEDRLQEVISLQVKPTHQAIPTITGSAISSQAGTVLYGYYNMDYRLPGGDRLRILANHNKKTVQLLLLTHDPEKLHYLPGDRPSSLVANTISQINRYRIRSDSYEQPRTAIQLAKYQLATTCIEELKQLLEEERSLTCDNWGGQEALRTKVIKIIEKCCAGNLLLANNPVISEGELNSLLYDTQQAVQHYQFNRVHPVTRIDQLDYTQYNTSESPCFVWDSELHIGHDENTLNDAIRVICQQYNLSPAPALSNIAANRFKRLELFLYRLWQNGHDWVNYLANSNKPNQITRTEKRSDGLSITKISPYYHLHGLTQTDTKTHTGYATLEDLLAGMTDAHLSYFKSNSVEEATKLLSTCPNGSWVQLSGQQLILRLANEMITINYFEEKGLYYPLPCGQDLFILSQLGKRHLYLPERVGLQLKAFFSRLPIHFNHLYHHMKRFVSHDLRDEFTKHVHAEHAHIRPLSKLAEESEVRGDAERRTGVYTSVHEDSSTASTKQFASSVEFGKRSIETSQKKNPNYLVSLQEILKSHGSLKNGQTLEEFVQTQINKNHYVIVREMHPPSPPAYDNPLHRGLGVLRHIAGFFVDTSEKNPIIGTLAMAAYAYGAGAVIAPEMLTNILMKLHLNGLIYGIKPTQALGQWMSHGTSSEAISAAVTYWQGVVVGGDLDQFFIKAVGLLQDDAAEVAIIVALALSLGYGMCKAIPTLQEEMGQFPYINYTALGAKGGAALYDTVMHPGDDWLLGSIKWFLRGGLTLGKLLIGPLAEGYYYGYRNGFLLGLKKSGTLLATTIKQIFAAIVDLFLTIATIPLLEISALLLHVPFRGVSKFLSKSLATMGNWRALGQILIDFALRPGGWNYLPGFRLSPLYGFRNPFDRYAKNPLANILLNLIMFLLLPPFDLIKNLVLLPVLDAISFFTRFTLTCLNPLSRLLAYTAGSILTSSAIVWDNSAGRIFHYAANLITLSSNWIEGIAGQLKQTMLTQLQISRRQVYHWAFTNEDLSSHKTNNDNDYFLAAPMRLEKLPHNSQDSTECLLNLLLSNKLPVLLSEKSEHSSYEGLFRPETAETTPQNFTPDNSLQIQNSSLNL